MIRFLAPLMFATLVNQCVSQVQQVAPNATCSFENGVKIGEIMPDAAIVWVRLTEQKTTLHSKDLNTLGPEVTGVDGEIKLEYWTQRTNNDTCVIDWVKVSAETDFIHQFKLRELKPGTHYFFKVLGRTRGAVQSPAFYEGTFTTAPTEDAFAPVRFAVVTCQSYHERDDGANGHRIYRQLLNEEPDFFVHTGDVVYYDRKNPVAIDSSTARFHWHRMYSLPNMLKFHRSVPSYFMKDDHDTLKDDCWPGIKTSHELTFEQGSRIFSEQVPMSERSYRTFRWGKHLQIWLMEGRDFRSPNSDPDGPNKTIWGKDQIQWLKSTVKASDATFKILISPTPLVGPDRLNKNDSHANVGFETEGQWARQWLKDNDLIVICGDRHWQFVSQDPKTGLWEFATGPTTDTHAGGFSLAKRTDTHKFLRIKGGYFMAEIELRNDLPVLVANHYSVEGKTMNTVVLDSRLNQVESTVNRSR
jgi:alkaline phosphatase D